MGESVCLPALSVEESVDLPAHFIGATSGNGKMGQMGCTVRQSASPTGIGLQCFRHVGLPLPCKGIEGSLLSTLTSAPPDFPKTRFHFEIDKSAIDINDAVSVQS